MGTRAEKLRQKIAELESQYKQELTKDKAKERKLDTRKKVLVGAMIFQWVKDGKFSQEELLTGLDRFLLRDYDRAVFNLPPKQKPFPAAASQSATSAQPNAKPPAVLTKTTPRSTTRMADQKSPENLAANPDIAEMVSAAVLSASLPIQSTAPESSPQPPTTEPATSRKKRLPESSQKAMEEQFMI